MDHYSSWSDLELEEANGEILHIDQVPFFEADRQPERCLPASLFATQTVVKDSQFLPPQYRLDPSPYHPRFANTSYCDLPFEFNDWNNTIHDHNTPVYRSCTLEGSDCSIKVPCT